MVLIICVVYSSCGREQEQRKEESILEILFLMLVWVLQIRILLIFITSQFALFCNICPKKISLLLNCLFCHAHPATIYTPPLPILLNSLLLCLQVLLSHRFVSPSTLDLPSSCLIPTWSKKLFLWKFEFQV